MDTGTGGICQPVIDSIHIRLDKPPEGDERTDRSAVAIA